VSRGGILGRLREAENNSSPTTLAEERQARAAAQAIAALTSRTLKDIVAYCLAAQTNMPDPQARMELEVIQGAVLGALYMHTARVRTPDAPRMKALAGALLRQIYDGDLMVDPDGNTIIPREVELIVEGVVEDTDPSIAAAPPKKEET